MKLPLVAPIDSRDGTSNKDSRQYNTLVEDDHGVKLAGVRPGLAAISTATGNGSGAVSFNGTLITVFGTNVGYGQTPTTISAVAAGTFDFAQSPI